MADALLGIVMYFSLLLGATPAFPRPDDRSRLGKGGAGERARYAQVLVELAQQDPSTAVLEYIEFVRPNAANCTSTHLSRFEYNLPDQVYRQFAEEETVAIQTANVFNSLFGVARSSTQTSDEYNDVFYYSIARSIVQGGRGVIYGSAIAFDNGQYSDESRQLSPYVYMRNGKYYTNNLDVASKGNRALNDSDACRWFLKQRSTNYSKLQHNYVCKKHMESASAAQRVNESTVVTTSRQGQWTQPYIDCDGARDWVVTYSVPFFGCSRHENIPSFK